MRWNKTGPHVRKGKAMLQIHANIFTTVYRPYDLQGTSMPSVKKAEWLNSTCLYQAGPSGNLGPGAFSCTRE